MKDGKFLTLAFESSCDETAVAVMADGREVLSNIISSQIDIFKNYGGVVPEIASRHHLENINGVMDRALDEAGVTLEDIDLIGVTKGPGLVGALLIGIATAKAVAMAAGKPLVGVHHLMGHISANFIEFKKLEPPFTALIVSGGQFKQSKPNPEIYHYTAKTLGIPEEECFVVEDSTVGIQAGKAAGMTVAALEDDRFGFDQSQADIQIRQISEILKFLPGTENIVLCGASSYEQKYYFNQDFKALPDHIKKELQIMCVLFTEDIGGVLTMEFTPEGELEFKVQADDKDYLFDEIGSGLKIRQYQREKKELLESLELYYRVVFLGDSLADLETEEETDA